MSLLQIEEPLIGGQLNGVLNSLTTRSITLNGQPLTMAQCKQNIATVAAPPAPLNQPSTQYTFDISGLNGNYFIVNFSSIAASRVTTPSLQGVAYDFFLSETPGGSYNPAAGCLKWNTGLKVDGDSFNSGPITMIYKASDQISGLYLNIIQTSAGQGGYLTNLSVACEILSQTAQLQ